MLLFFEKKVTKETLCIMHFAFCIASCACLVGPSGLEPPTSCLSGTRSTLLSYEPMWLVSDFSHLVGGDDGIRSRRELRALVADGSNSPPDCYSLPSLFESRFVDNELISIFVIWWRWWDSNPWPPACRAGALPAELHPHMVVVASTVFCKSWERRLPFSLYVSTELSSRTVARKVFSPLQSLTSVFGMGTGGPSAFVALTFNESCSLNIEQQ